MQVRSSTEGGSGGMDSVPRIQGAFAPLFLEEWGHIRGASRLSMEGSRWGSVDFGIYV